VGSVQSGSKEVFGRIAQSSEVKGRVSRRPPARTWALEQSNWIESSSGDGSLRRLKRNGKKGIKLRKEDSMFDSKWQWDCYKSVAWIRPMKTDNCSACATVNCDVCRSAYSDVLPVFPCTVYKMSNLVIQFRTRLQSQAQHPYTWQYSLYNAKGQDDNVW
jgi:hypothetical protein